MTKKRSATYIGILGMLVALLTAAETALAEQAHYASPEAAAQALIDAAVASDMDALKVVFGPEAEELSSGDPVADANNFEKFVDAAVTAAGIEQEEGDDSRATLVIGEDDWPFPIPLVKDDQGWRFDMDAGLDELYIRRIGTNELYALAVLDAIVDAQREYHAVDRDADGILEYAQKMGSSEGQKDGLYWPADEGEPQSPMGPLVAQAVAEGYEKSKDGSAVPYHGYYYHMLTGQGSNASGGAMSYTRDGNSVDGFGVLAYPAEYGNSGIMTFVVDKQGIVFEKDFGEQTPALAAQIEVFDPDNTWDPVTD